METANMVRKLMNKAVIPRITSLLVCMMLFAGSTHHGLQAQVLNEDTLKANYLIGFVDFIHWDRENKDPIIIGLAGECSLEKEIQSLVEKKKETGSNRGFEVRLLQAGQMDLHEIDVIFLPKGSEALWPVLIPQAMELGILTVGDSSGFLKAGGLIEFVIRKNRLRFTLNLDASDQYRIGLSSKLAHLAVND